MKEFKGRVVAPGAVKAEALVSHGGLNTLASFQKALQFGDKKATCGDQEKHFAYHRQSVLPPAVWYYIVHVLWEDSLHVCYSPNQLTPSQEQALS